MFKLSRMTDYGVVILSHMAMAERPGQPRKVMTAPMLADETGLPRPTVVKLLKQMAKGGLVNAHRGAQGGYSLARPASAITVREIVAALEGRLALTACVEGADDGCGVEECCPIRGRWDPVNEAVSAALEGVTLARMAAFGTDRFKAFEGTLQ